MVSPEHRHVVGVHHPVDEADQYPLGDERRLARCDPAQQTEVAIGVGREIGIVAGDDVVGQRAHRFVHAARGEELERSHPHVARGHARQQRAGKRLLAPHHLTAADRRQRPGGRDAERVHRLANQVLAQHRADRGFPVAAARERRAARALEGNVAAPAVSVDHLAQEYRAAIAELRDTLRSNASLKGTLSFL